MEIHFPAIWLKAIKRNGRPYLEAIHILATCPWEDTPYLEIGEQLQMTRKRVKYAVEFLVRKGCIIRTEKKGGCTTLIRLEIVAEEEAKTSKHSPPTVPVFSRNLPSKGTPSQPRMLPPGGVSVPLPQPTTRPTPAYHQAYPSLPPGLPQPTTRPTPRRNRPDREIPGTREHLLAHCVYKHKKIIY